MSDNPLRPRARERSGARRFPPRRLDADARISEDEPVDFVIVGTGAGGGTLACNLRNMASQSSRPTPAHGSGRWRISPPTNPSKQTVLDRRSHRRRRQSAALGGNNSGKAVGGSTVHFAMVSLRFRPEWFKSRSLLGYGADWPLDWREMWVYYGEVEQALKIAGPVNYPWGPQRPRYPYRAHEMNAAARRWREGCEAMGIDWTETPLATLSAPRGLAHPCVYRGFCGTGCSTNAKQSALVTWIPRADCSRRGNPRPGDGRRIEADGAGLATGVHYHREGRWRFQRARNVVVAGYAIETPRLLLNSATDRFPDGLANSPGLVGKNLMAQSNQAVWGELEQEVRSYKGPPSLAITEHWNYEDKGKDFFGGYSYMSQGPLPQLWANTLMSARGLWGARLIREMEKYNHVVGLKIVGEMLPQESNRVTLADDVDQYGLRIPRITYSWCDNDKRLIDHSLKFMTQALQAIDANDIWIQEDDTCHLNGTARMGDDLQTSVVNADCRSWDIRNLWICDGSVFPTVGASIRLSPSRRLLAGRRIGSGRWRTEASFDVRKSASRHEQADRG